MALRYAGCSITETRAIKQLENLDPNRLFLQISVARLRREALAGIGGGYGELKAAVEELRDYDKRMLVRGEDAGGVEGTRERKVKKEPVEESLGESGSGTKPFDSTTKSGVKIEPSKRLDLSSIKTKYHSDPSLQTPMTIYDTPTGEVKRDPDTASGLDFGPDSGFGQTVGSGSIEDIWRHAFYSTTDEGKNGEGEVKMEEFDTFEEFTD